MKLIFDRKGNQEPNDAEIERDVAELRALLSRIEEPAEPHPAYWQNFLVKVRNRVDEERVQRRRWAPSMALTSMAAAALVVVVAVSGVLPLQNHRDAPPGVDAKGRRPLPQAPAAPADVASIYAGDADQSLMLSSDDIVMLDAILDESPEAVLAAMVESDS